MNVKAKCTGTNLGVHRLNIQQYPHTYSTFLSILIEQYKSAALSQDGKIAVGSSVTVFGVASLLFFIVGFLCVRRKGKQQL